MHRARRRERREALHRRQVAEEGDPVTDHPARRAGLSDAAERAAAALRILSEREQQLVILKVYEGKSYREISEITGLSVTNVGYILHQAMKKLAQELGKERTAP